MSLGGRLRSGLTYPIEGLSDWAVFQEVLVNGAYESAISRVLENTLEPEFHVLDLGCNVGFFTLYLIDRLVREEQFNFRFACVDASLQVLETAAKTFAEQPHVKLAGKVHLLHGLVGLREGEAPFNQQSFHAASTRELGEVEVLAVGNIEGKRRYANPNISLVPYLDLEAVCPNGRLVLIKCDIEGAEVDFLRTYPELLKRTQFFLVEWHARLISVGEGEGLLRDLGFTCVEHHQRGSTSTALWMNKAYQSAEPRLIERAPIPTLKASQPEAPDGK